MPWFRFASALRTPFTEERTTTALREKAFLLGLAERRHHTVVLRRGGMVRLSRQTDHRHWASEWTHQSRWAHGAHHSSQAVHAQARTEERRSATAVSVSLKQVIHRGQGRRLCKLRGPVQHIAGSYWGCSEGKQQPNRPRPATHHLSCGWESPTGSWGRRGESRAIARREEQAAMRLLLVCFLTSIQTLGASAAVRRDVPVMEHYAECRGRVKLFCAGLDQEKCILRMTKLFCPASDISITLLGEGAEDTDKMGSNTCINTLREFNAQCAGDTFFACNSREPDFVVTTRWRRRALRSLYPGHPRSHATSNGSNPAAHARPTTTMK